jgi:hypothetical protein
VISAILAEIPAHFLAVPLKKWWMNHALGRAIKKTMSRMLGAGIEKTL